MKDKVLNNIARINLSALLLIGLVIKVVLMGTSIGDSIAIIALCGLKGYDSFREKITVTAEETIKNDLKRLEDEISNLKMANNIRKTHDPQQKKQDKRFF